MRQNANIALDISAGPLVRALFRPPGQFGPQHLILYCTGHQDICRAIRFQIMLARTITNLIIYFSRGHLPHISAVFAQSFCNSDTPAWCESESDLSIKHTDVSDQAQQCLDHAARDTSMQISVACGTLFYDKHMCKQFCICRMYCDFRSVLIDIVMLSVVRVIVRLKQ